MRLLITLFLLLTLGLFSAFAHAQDSDLSVYEVADVGADVTADSAAHARDQAVMQAQRSAFEQLLQRLGADAGSVTNLSDDDIGNMVQNFEVQNERSSAVRYIGTFTVQFRPNAVRAFLGNHSATYNDTRSKPVVVLPVIISNGHPVLWEETTKWRMAWENGSRGGGLVPVVIPQGGLDDIAVVSTEEAVSGKPYAMKSIADKYAAGGALVAVLSGDPAKAGSDLKIELWRYDADGDSSPPVSISLPVTASKDGGDVLLAQAVRQCRTLLEKEWKQAAKDGMKMQVTDTSDEAVSVQPPAGPPTTHLPVSVPIATLADWTQIQQRLNHIPSIVRTDVLTLERGMSNIEIEFQGSLGELQTALMRQQLSLMQDPANGTWILQALAPSGRL